MTNEQRVRVDRLERYLITDREKTYTTVRVNDLDTVLSLIKKQQEEIENTKELYDRALSDLVKADKQIDLMANCILAREIGKMTCQFNEKCTKYENGRDIHCKDCIKQYFVDKAKKETKET